MIPLQHVRRVLGGTDVVEVRASEVLPEVSGLYLPLGPLIQVHSGFVEEGNVADGTVV